MDPEGTIPMWFYKCLFCDIVGVGQGLSSEIKYSYNRRKNKL